MVDRLTLIYKRGVGESFTGCIHLESDVGTGAVVRFEDSNWVRVLSHFSDTIQRHPQAEVQMQRSDRDGLPVMRLSEDFVDLLRTDVVAAIKATSIEPQVVLTSVKEDKPVNVMLPVPAGYDALIASFGDVICIRCKPDKGNCPMVESPYTGSWTTLDELDLGTLSLDLTSGWAAIKTHSLLLRPAQRYFLPRPWNKNPPWISRSELSDMYSAYLKEKFECYQSDVK